MTQLMQPLARFGDQPPSTGFGQIRIAVEALPETGQPFRSTGRQQVLQRFGQLLLQKTVEPLLTSLQIGTAALTFQAECLLQRFLPGQKFLELIPVQPPGFSVLGSSEFCQGVSASRSRQRRSQWRC